MSIIFSIITVGLIICAVFAFRSKKPIGKYVSLVLISLVPPVLGNLFIIGTPYEWISIVGSYLYFIGMDFVMFAVILFTLRYCHIKWPYKFLPFLVYGILIADVISLLLNIAFHHCFVTKPITVEGNVYYTFDALLGQTIHRVVDYGLLAIIILVFFIKALTSSRVTSEKYWVILIVMLLVTALETYYIFARIPVDISMTGFGLFGFLIFFFALHYRPLKLLDRMLATIASKMPESLFFYDNHDRCIWANNQGKLLLNLNNDEFDKVNERLTAKFGNYQKEGNEWMTTFMSGTDEAVESYYVIEKHPVVDDKGRVVGSFISVRDSTVEQQTIQRETYNATHDSLTKIYNRAGYNSIVSTIDLKTVFFLMIDADSFKEVNDTYGHEIGDKVLINIVNTIKKHFREDDYMCRIGGDEFVIFVQNADENTATVIENRIKRINEELRKNNNGLPVVTISAGGAYGRYFDDEFALFESADQAMYKTKKGGKNGFTLFVKE